MQYIFMVQTAKIVSHRDNKKRGFDVIIYNYTFKWLHFEPQNSIETSKSLEELYWYK